MTQILFSNSMVISIIWAIGYIGICLMAIIFVSTIVTLIGISLSSLYNKLFIKYQKHSITTGLKTKERPPILITRLY